jgi:bifunctional non-homologous end joining protein LigD
VHDERGLPSFARLQKRGRLRSPIDAERAALDLPATFYAFDLPSFSGYDLRPLALVDRKALLEALLPAVGPVRYSQHVLAQGTALFAEAERMGLEGIVAKRAASPYAGKRSTDWVKVNAAKSDDFVVVDYVRAKSGAGGFGALLLGQYAAAGELVYAGRVGSGFAAAALRTLGAALDRAAPADPPQGAPRERDAVWTAPGPVVQVKFKQRGSDGALRQPVFMRVRDDKSARDCVAPETAAESAANDEAQSAADDGPPRFAAGGAAGRAAGRGKRAAAAPRAVDLTNLDKVFWPEDGYTKGDLIDYYSRVADWLLPYLADRPVVLTRFPDGIYGKSFFQKDAPVYAPNWLRLETMWSEQAEREIRYFVLDDLDSLVYVINLGTIPLHVWSSRVSSLERPDWCILDLDPKGAPFKDVVAIARFLRELCGSVGLATFVKSSGSTGLHVLIPLGARYTYEQSRTLAELLARFAVNALPDIATVVRAVGERDGKVYVDYLQNGHGRLLVAPFSVRPLPGAPVSMPLTWSKVTPRLRLGNYTLENAPRLLARDGDPLAGILKGSADMLAALEKLTSELSR